jgi:urate oxidase
MGITLGPNQYGKAENRVVRVYRDTERHEIRDLNVSTSLRGDFSDAHITGEQGDVLPTDTQKNTAFAFAKEKGVISPEQFGLTLGGHFLDATPKATASRIGIEEYTWERLEVGGIGHNHSFVRRGPEVRTAVVTTDDSQGERRAWVVSGVQDLVILKSTGSGFKGFLTDKYTTLQETEDRIMATALTARWRYEHGEVEDWNATYDDIKRIMLEVFADLYSKALQQTLYMMGKAVLEAHDEVAEIKFSAPNKHHFVVDLAPFGVQNNNAVFIAADRPYGLIEASVVREGGSDPGDAWLNTPGFC